jgi:hypothetical protein
MRNNSSGIKIHLKKRGEEIAHSDARNITKSLFRGAWMGGREKKKKISWQ